jgi:hypothetical protein
MRKALLGPIVLLVVFVLGALWSYVPHLTQKRTVVLSTPSLQGFTSSKEVLVRGGQQACISPVPLEPGLQKVRMILHARGATASPLELELKAGGYRGTGRFAGYQAGGNATVEAPVSPAPTGDVDGVLCLRNTGRRAVGLVGTDEPVSQSLPATQVDGHAVVPDPALTFIDGPPRSMISHFGTILGRAADFTGVLPLWLLWPLVLAFVLGAPLALAWALYSSAQRD